MVLRLITYKDEGFKISEHPCLEYYKLGEIRLSYYPDDMNTDDDDMEKIQEESAL